MKNLATFKIFYDPLNENDNFWLVCCILRQEVACKMLLKLRPEQIACWVRRWFSLPWLFAWHSVHLSEQSWTRFDAFPATINIIQKTQLEVIQIICDTLWGGLREIVTKRVCQSVIGHFFKKMLSLIFVFGPPFNGFEKLKWNSTRGWSIEPCHKCHMVEVGLKWAKKLSLTIWMAPNSDTTVIERQS